MTKKYYLFCTKYLYLHIRTAFNSKIQVYVVLLVDYSLLLKIRAQTNSVLKHIYFTWIFYKSTYNLYFGNFKLVF